MARNGSGTYSKINTFVSGNSITAAGHNQNWDDLVTEMTNSVAADGQTTITGQLKGSSSGSVSAPAFSFSNDLNTGIYRTAADNLGITCGGVLVATFGSAGVPTIQRLTSGSGTYTTPTGCRYIHVRMVGGGGGGGASNTNDGTDGGTSSFGSWTAIKGGGGGTTGHGHGQAGIGGVDGTGTLLHRVAGQYGNTAIIVAAGCNVPGGQGGNSVFGGAGSEGTAGLAGGNAAANSGSGGGGGSNSTTEGASGGGGAEYVEFLVNSPAATYSYTVGAKGTAGAAGGKAGGDGGAGIIIVEEFYS